jgi:large subunit ribosomal protein L25
MEHLTLEAARRKVSGKKVRFLRRQGQTPASLYGPGIESVSIQADTRKMEQVLVKAGGTDLISLAVAGAKPVKVLVREVQKEPLTDQLLHVDFYQVDLTQKITAEVPIHFFGEAPALKLGNVSVLHQVDMLEVEALPEHLPHRIEIDLSVLTEIDQAIHVKDINLGSDVTIISDPESVVTRAVETKVEVEVVEAPAAEVAAEAPEAAEAGKAETEETETDE